MNGVAGPAAPGLLVSVTELLEVRAAPLLPHELLALAATAAAGALPPCPRGRAFGPAQLFIGPDGGIKIEIVQSESLPSEFHPPEWSSEDAADPTAASVFCLGAVLRAAGAAVAADADLFSLVNVLTVSMVGTRPTAARASQMAKNQLRGQASAPILQAAFQEIMGDGSDLMDDDDDDVSFNSDDVPVLKTKSAAAVIHPPLDTAGSAKKAVEYISDDEDDDLDEDASDEDDFGHDTAAVSGSNGHRHFHEEIPDRSRSFHVESPLANSTRILEEDEDELSHEEKKETKKPQGEAEFHKQPNGAAGGRTTTNSVLAALRTAREESDSATTSPFALAKQQRVASYDEEDDIVHARVDELDEVLPSSGGRRYFDEIASERERREEEEAREKKQQSHHAPPTPPSTSSSPTSSLSPLSQRHYSDTATAEKRPSAPTPKKRMSVREASDDEEEEEGRAGSLRHHVDAVVIHEQKPSQLNGRQQHSDDEDELAGGGDAAIDEVFEEAIETRRKSLAAMGHSGSSATPSQDAPSSTASLARASTAASSGGAFQRRNSLAAGRMSARNSKRRPNKTRAEPEFVEKEQLPAIRLKAPPTRKKNLLTRVETTSVSVRLLDGQLIQVSCRSDAIASDVFSLVVANSNIGEHIFFGLCVERDGEPFFLDDDQRLEKFAPPGWKSPRPSTGLPPNPYLLFLRFRYYPALDDFIKTPATRHALFLQLRRDVLAGRLETTRDVSFELAAIALQAEFHDRPPPAVVDYFDPTHYLPQRILDREDRQRLRPLLSELHSHYMGTSCRAAEIKYIKTCQAAPFFGGHWHRVFRSKNAALASSASPFDAEHGATLWLGIMPKGIVVAEQQGGQRRQIAEHPWQRTHTLQFDKKRFVIVDMATDEEGERRESIFYTDHHSKSSYFVRFAASQHRFMIKMRQWRNQLRSEKRVASMPDVAVEGREPPSSPLEEAASLFEKVPVRHPSGGLVVDLTNRGSGTQPSSATVLDMSLASRDRTLPAADTSATESFLARLDAASAMEGVAAGGAVEGEQLKLSIVKDPSSGLGLTLVDGQLNGVSGIYVKNVVDGGPGAKAGLCVGDRLLSVNGESLLGADRHRAVALVKASSALVTLAVTRLDAIVAQQKGAVLDLSSGTLRKGTPAGATAPLSAADLASGSLAAVSNRLSAPGVTSAGGSRTPPAPRRAPQRRARAVSDFGAIGDALPELNSEDLISDIKNTRTGNRLGSDSDEEAAGEYRVPVTASIYEDGDAAATAEDTPRGAAASLAAAASAASRRTRGVVEASPASASRFTAYARSGNSNLDWADELDDVGEESNEDEDDRSSCFSSDGEAVFEVELERNESGSLGVQVSSTGGRARIQAVTAKPALGHPLLADGDYLISVNGESTEGCTHAEVVGLLRGGGRTVRLGLQRALSDEKIRVVLDKTNYSALGLSLAKRVGCEGVFVRMIGAASAAEAVGTIRVGDRVWKVDGDKVGEESPTRIVERLKAADGPVELVVRRPVNTTSPLPSTPQQQKRRPLSALSNASEHT